jgi:hypothetical protein
VSVSTCSHSCSRNSRSRGDRISDERTGLLRSTAMSAGECPVWPD